MKAKTEAELLQELKAMKLPPVWLKTIKAIGARKFLRLFKKLEASNG